MVQADPAMIIAIVGPTGVGKSALAVALAEHYEAEIVGADSVQIYRGLDIGSAKPPMSIRKRIPHHLVDFLEPDDTYSVAQYQQDARDALRDITSRGRTALLVGGTGLYIKAVLHDFRLSGTRRDPSLEAYYRDYSNDDLHAELKRLDPPAAEKTHPNNRKRVLHGITRALRGNPVGEERRGERPVYDYIMFALEPPRSTLHARIDQRVEAMFDAGLLREAEWLHQQFYKTKAEEAIGYKELFAYFDGRLSLAEAKARIKRNTRRYARRQLTYFRNQFDAHWLPVGVDDFDATVTAAIRVIEQHKNRPAT